MSTTTTPTGQEYTAVDSPTPGEGAVTIYHVDRDAFESRSERLEFENGVMGDAADGMGEPLCERAFAEYYTPTESVVGTTDLDEAMHRTQGVIVAENQNARHGVPSAHPGCVFECIYPTGERSYHLVEQVGFAELELAGSES